MPKPSIRLRGIRKLAYINKQVVGDGWVMIGDAAGFLDPVYSSGLFLALVSGDLASNCIHEALESNDLRAEKLGGFRFRDSGKVLKSSIAWSERSTIPLLVSLNSPRDFQNSVRHSSIA